MDRRSAKMGGTLLQLCAKGAQFIDPDKWDAFYDTVNDMLAEAAAITREHRAGWRTRACRVVGECVERRRRRRCRPPNHWTCDVEGQGHVR